MPDRQARSRLPRPSGLVIRRVRASDQEPLREFYSRLSPDSRRARFLGYQAGLSSQLAGTFCTPDHLHAEGFVAVMPADGGSGETIVGHLCLEPAASDSVELAVAVADDQQRRGLGRALFEAAIAWAHWHRLRSMVASAFADNAPVLRLLTSSPYPARVSPADGGVVEVVIPLQPDLPPELAYVPPAGGSRRAARRRAAGRGTRVSPSCRVVGRRTQPPVRDAASSASRGSS